MSLDPRRTVVFPANNGQIWLGEKKLGHGAGFLNGFGGKVEVGESVEQALVRECEEEVGITPTSFRQIAELEFYNQSAQKDDRRITLLTYLCDAWLGTPHETDEMKPVLFNLYELPLERMWPSDRLWLPRALGGELLHGEIYLGKGGLIKVYDFERVDSFEKAA